MEVKMKACINLEKKLNSLISNAFTNGNLFSIKFVNYWR